MRVLNTPSAGFSLRVGKKGNAAVFNISSAGIYLDKWDKNGMQVQMTIRCSHLQWILTLTVA